MASKLQFYLAGKWDDHVLLETKVTQLERETEYAVSHAWMRKNVGLSKHFDAVSDIQGVQRCDVFIAVFTDIAYPYRGTFTELGAALALQKLVIVVSPIRSEHETSASFRTNVFFHHPSIHHVTTWDEVLHLMGARDMNGEIPKKRKLDAAAAANPPHWLE
jgi:nucleoside 2-deoxyribosyltransferase